MVAQLRHCLLISRVSVLRTAPRSGNTRAAKCSDARPGRRRYLPALKCPSPPRPSGISPRGASNTVAAMLVNWRKRSTEAERIHPLDVPTHGDEAPFAANAIETAQQELTESRHRFDNTEHRFRGLLAQGVELLALRVSAAAKPSPRPAWGSLAPVVWRQIARARRDDVPAARSQSAARCWRPRTPVHSPR
jgi:hypothetical protein